MTVDPPALRGKKKRTLKPDARQELLSHDVAGWADNYLDQMQQVIRGKMQLRSNALAKKNADFWVLQNGVGGLSTVFGNEEIPEPLRMFTGVSLLESLTGLKITAAGTKRARADSVEQPESGVGEDGRRVRDRSEEVELGRRHDDVMMEDAGYGADEGGYTGVNRVVEGRDEVRTNFPTPSGTADTLDRRSKWAEQPRHPSQTTCHPSCHGISQHQYADLLLDLEAGCLFQLAALQQVQLVGVQSAAWVA